MCITKNGIIMTSSFQLKLTIFTKINNYESKKDMILICRYHVKHIHNNAFIHFITFFDQKSFFFEWIFYVIMHYCTNVLSYIQILHRELLLFKFFYKLQFYGFVFCNNWALCLYSKTFLVADFINVLIHCLV